MTPERWEPSRSTLPGPGTNAWLKPSLAVAIGRGLLGRCPSCGKGRIFDGFLKVVDACAICAAPLGLIRADDAPPYFTILIVAHVVVPLMFMVEHGHDISLWVISAIFLPLTVALTLAIMRPVKGGTVGLMFNLNMYKSDPGAA